jgi:Pyridoxamine 5'-phosphate oxidase
VEEEVAAGDAQQDLRISAQAPPRRYQHNQFGFTTGRVVGIAVTEELDIVFDTLSTSRKYANLRTDPRVALTVWHDAETVQYEGIADIPSGADLDACKRVYFEGWPDGPEREKWPDIAYVRIRPRWIRYSDFTQTPARIEELNLAR